MPNENHVKSFLGRLESTICEKGSDRDVLRLREAKHIASHLRHRSYPGRNYVFIGQSENLEHRIVGTESQHKRSTSIDLLLDAKGNENHCVRLDIALGFEGFGDVLSRFERDLLSSLPAHTMLGPAYDKNCERISGVFTVWRPLCEDAPETPVLIGARS